MKKTNNKTMQRIDTAKLCWGYLFPNIMDARFHTLKPPSDDELRYIGRDNLELIRLYLDHIEFELTRKSKLYHEATSRINDLNLMHLTRNGEISLHCDWCGEEYGNPSDELLNQVIAPGDFQGWDAVREGRKRAVFSCRFGPEVAARCPKNPQPCDQNYQCYHVLAEQSTDEPYTKVDGWKTTVRIFNVAQSIGIEPCQHEAICFGSQPLLKEKCIFSSMTEKELAQFRKELENDRDEIDERIMFAHSYLITVKRIAAESDLPERPVFSLDPSVCLLRLNRCDTVMEIIRKPGAVDEGSLITVTPAVYAGTVTRRGEKTNRSWRVINTADGRSTRLSGDVIVGDNKSSSRIYLGAAAFRELVKDRQFREVWLRSIQWKEDGITPDELGTVFEAYENVPEAKWGI